MFSRRVLVICVFKVGVWSTVCVFRFTGLLVWMGRQVGVRRSTCSCGTLRDRRGAPLLVLAFSRFDLL